MQSQDVAPSPAPEPYVDVDQAEAALVEHYPRLVQLAYLVLPPGLGRTRRVLTAHALAQRALPRDRAATPAIPAQSTGRDGDPGYALMRQRVLRSALDAGRPRRRLLPRRGHLPPLLPQVWGLKLYPRSGGADGLALDQRLSGLSAAGRAAYVLRGVERLPDAETRRALEAAGVADPDGALREADKVPADRARLLETPEFDPCALQARPTDLMRRRQHVKAALVGVAALAVAGALLGMPGDGWGPDGAAAPAYARNPAAQAALDPARLTKVPADAWKTASRNDFSVWPARGRLAGDQALLRRALAVWARPGETVRVSATPGTQAGGPAGPPQLLYAGEVDNARVVLLHDGLRIARYAEPKEGTAGAALDLARVDGASAAESSALVLSRSDGNVRYLLAPWVTEAAERDLLEPSAGAMDLTVTDGVTSPLAGPGTQSGSCSSWNVLQVSGRGGTRLLTDLGELVPARLTTGRPGAYREASTAAGLRAWQPIACNLSTLRSAGVRAVNAWAYAEQVLPENAGAARWTCTRAETWRGDGTRALAQFQTPVAEYGAVVAQSQDSPACGPRDASVLAGVLWKADSGSWYLLAAGSANTASIQATGAVRGSGQGSTLALPATEGARADVEGVLRNGRKITGLR